MRWTTVVLHLVCFFSSLAVMNGQSIVCSNNNASAADPSSCIRTGPSCRQASTFGKCNDPYCQTRVCTLLKQSQCCEEAWSSECALLAQQVCVLEVLPKPLNGRCPLGYFCSTEENEEEQEGYMTDCAALQNLTLNWQLGDLFGGIYCPASVNAIRNCNVGFYCPTPSERYPCPAGFFCDYKTATPGRIACAGCKEGATQQVRHLFGYFVFSLGLCVMLALVGISRLRRRYQDKMKLQMTLLARQVDSYRFWKTKDQQDQKERLQRLRPKLEEIDRLLVQLREQDASVSILFPNEKQRHSAKGESLKGPWMPLPSFSAQQLAKRLFDALDLNQDGILSYKELNNVLQLLPIELDAFMHRMHTLTTTADRQKKKGNEKHAKSKSVGPTNTVDRPTFVMNFLEVLEELKHWKLSPDEAKDFYHEMVEEQHKDGIPGPHLQTSRLYKNKTVSAILTEEQVYVLIKKFREIPSPDNWDYGDPSERKVDEFSKGSIFESARRFTSTRPSNSNLIHRDVFKAHYPRLLTEVTIGFDPAMARSMINSHRTEEQRCGVDICFEDLCLGIDVGDKTINVVDHVTGRIQAKTMTALMGGSGAGKTSLLNALCGRAFYGNVTGKIHVNGQLKSIENIQDSVGFVPQDDIVFAELTVKENLIYAGKFRLPRGTPLAAIEDLADETMASLGLTRVADNLVGDVKRRGVSGGEKKRVNIGLELMSLPQCLFLDEPTSGLDSSSALLVMQSLKNLVSKRGVTVVSVIHQPRKVIFEMFDSLVLLGVGGRMVYHGPVDRALNYFESLNYVLPTGESTADFFIDISSGRLTPETGIGATKDEDKRRIQLGDMERHSKSKRKKKKKQQHQIEERIREVEIDENRPVSSVCGKEVLLVESIKSEDSDPAQVVDEMIAPVEGNGDPYEEAKARRSWLYAMWNDYMKSLQGGDKLVYAVPRSSPLPEPVNQQSFLSQCRHQVGRSFLLSWRNLPSKLVDTTVLVVATFFIAITSGLPVMTAPLNPSLDFENVVNPSKQELPNIFKELFKYAILPQVEFPLKIGVIVSVLVGLQATKIITDKRVEFFREAGSGYNINAYYFAVNLVATTEHSLQVLMIAFFSAWLREPTAHWSSYFAHFLGMSWIVVSWALLVPMVFPPDNVIVVMGFFMAFCGLMISGVLPPVTFARIYSNKATELLSGWLSPTRFFFEGLIAGEYRCLPPQSGWVADDDSVAFDRSISLMNNVPLGHHDPNITQPSCYGWFWGILPSILVGLTIRFLGGLAMHTLNRPQQTKKPLLVVIKRDRRVLGITVASVIVLLFLFAISTWSFTRDLSQDYEFIPVEDVLAAENSDDLQALFVENNLEGLLELNEGLKNVPLEQSIMTGVFPEATGTV